MEANQVTLQVCLNGNDIDGIAMVAALAELRRLSYRTVTKDGPVNYDEDVRTYFFWVDKLPQALIEVMDSVQYLTMDASPNRFDYLNRETGAWDEAARHLERVAEGIRDGIAAGSGG